VDNPIATRVQRVYLVLVLGNTLAGSFIWGINTLFLLDAGLTNLEAFAANAFFTAGMVIFEVPTGVVADTWGRRTSFLLGTVTLALATFLYWLLWVWHAPFWPWAAVSVALGLGFTFFSGALEAWLVDALEFAKFDGDLDTVLGRGQMASGIAMLIGSAAGGAIAQVTSLGVPFLVRTGVLAAMFVVAFALMKDLGFTPDPKHPLRAMRTVLRASIDHGLRHRPVRGVMLAAPFAGAAGIYAFYAAQPHLLELYGDPHAYTIAGLAAALVAGAQIAGGYLAPKIRALFARRTSTLLLSAAVNVGALIAIGLAPWLWLAIALLALWALVFAAEHPIRQAYLNGMIPSKQRATVLSFDSLMGSSGGVVAQPVLGRVADVYHYPLSFVLAGAFSALSIPFLLASRRANDPADVAADEPEREKS
jgi:MFS family permease